MTSSLPATFKQAAFKEQGARLVLEDVPLKMPAALEILVKVEACGICHSDIFARDNSWGVGFPIVPGHEIIGKVAAVGSSVTGWNIGDRIGSGFHGGYDGTCRQCKEGLTQWCPNVAFTGITRNGGLAEFCLVRWEAAIHIPAKVDAAKFAPILCAGSTVFTALTATPITPGKMVAIQGIGGLGHLAIQFANRMGFRVVAISRGADKEKSARELGAHEYIDASKGDIGDALKALGGATLILTTALSEEASRPLAKGLAIKGRLRVITGLPGDMTLPGTAMIMMGNGVDFWPVPNPLGNEEAVEFADLQGFEAEVQTFSLDKVQEAFDVMVDGSARFRSVVIMS